MLRGNTTTKLENKAGGRFTGFRSVSTASKIAMAVLALVGLATLFAPLLST